MRVAVTGATGFVGGRLVRGLLTAGHQVVACGRRPGAAPIAGVDHRCWDITEPATGMPAVDAVVHCAGTVTDFGPRATFAAVNIAGTRNVLAAFASAQTFVHISSASVYDAYSPKRSISEDAPHPRRFLNAYSWSKVEAEREVKRARRQAVVLRPHIVYGPGDLKIIPRLLASGRWGWMPIPGSGRNLLSITHVDNLVAAILLAIERRNGFEVFNVADSEPVALERLVRAVLSAHGKPGRLLKLPVPLAWGGGAVMEAVAALGVGPSPPLLTRYVVAQLASEYTLDISRARRLLGYAPRLSYEDELGGQEGPNLN